MFLFAPPLFASLAPPARYTYIATTTDQANASSYSFASQSLSIAHSSRSIIVAISYRGAVTATVSSVTIAGIAATPIFTTSATNGAGYDLVAFYGANVPAGATGDIEVVLSDVTSRMRISTWAAYGLASLTASDTAASNDLSSWNLGVDVVNNSIILATGIVYNNGTFTWTGLTERVDSALESTLNGTTADGLATTTQTPRTITASISGDDNSGSRAACIVLN